MPANPRSAAATGLALVSYRGIYLDDHGKLSRLPAELVAATFAG